jgi:hypothetical protein
MRRRVSPTKDCDVGELSSEITENVDAVGLASAFRGCESPSRVLTDRAVE